DYVYKGAANAVVKRNGTIENLVKEETVLFENTPIPPKNNFFLSPLFVLGLLGLLIVFITYKDYKRKTRSRFLDLFIFLFTGLIGILLLLLWFATDHTATANNYNLLWAFPISILLIAAVVRKNISP